MKKIIITAMLLLWIFSLTGCTEQKAPEGSIEIFYINKDFTGLSTKFYVPESDETILQLEEVLNQLYMDEKDIEHNPSKPDNVQLVKYEVKDKIARIYFDKAYYEMSSVRELLCRAALVLTVGQIPRIDYVEISVDGQVLLNADKNPVGNMQENDFISLYGDSQKLKQQITTTLYYANEAGDRLIPFSYTGTYQSNESIEEYIIRQLMNDQKEEGLYQTIPKGVVLNSVATKDGVCYLDFNGVFNEKFLDIEDEVAIYSIVNSLAETNNIVEVEITINGEKNLMYHETISLKQPFMRNLDIVEEIKD